MAELSLLWGGKRLSLLRLLHNMSHTGNGVLLSHVTARYRIVSYRLYLWRLKDLFKNISKTKMPCAQVLKGRFSKLIYRLYELFTLFSFQKT